MCDYPCCFCDNCVYVLCDYHCYLCDNYVHAVDSFHIPVIVSFPHFFMADPHVIHSVDGINPVPEEHETAVDVEPVSWLLQ